MAVPLVYEISVLGEDRMRRVLRGIESEAKASATRMENVGRRGGRTPASTVGRGFDQIGRAARAADASVWRARVAGIRKAESEHVRSLKRVESEEKRAIERAARARASAHERIGRGAARGAMRGVGNVLRAGTMVAGTAAAALGGVGAFNAVQSRIGINASAASLANQAFGADPDDKRSRQQIADSVKANAARIDKRSGIGEENVLGGLRGFTAVAGKLKAGEQLIDFMANLTDAVDANIGDVGKAGGQIYKAAKLGGATDEQALAQTKEVLASIAQQSKIGSIEMQDYAAHMVEITMSAGRFSGKAPQLIKFMSALGQLSGFDSAEAATAVARIPSDLITNQKKANAFLGGKGIYTDKTKTQLRDPTEIMLDLLDKTHGDLAKTGDIFQERSLKAFEPLRKTYTEAERNKKGSGRAAVEALLKPYMVADMTEGDIKASASFRAGQEDRQLSKAHGEFNRAIGNVLLPELTKVIPKFAEMVPAIAKFTEKLVSAGEFLASHPWVGLGGLIGASIVKEIAAAKIADLIAGAFRGGGGGGGGGLPPGVKGPGGINGGLIGAVTAATIGAGAAIAEETGATFNDPLLAAKQTMADLSESRLAEADGGAGALSSRDALRRRKAELQSSLSEAQKGPGVLATIGAGLSSLVGGQSAGEMQQASVTALQAAIDALSKALAQGGDELVNKISNANVDRRGSPVLDR